MPCSKKFIKKYKKEIILSFPLYKKEEKKYVKKFFERVDAYLEDAPETTQEELIREFGSPKDVAADYMIMAEPDHLIKRIRTSYNIRRGFYALIAIIFAACVSVNVIMYLTYLDMKQHHIDSIEVDLEEGENVQ